MRFFFSSWPLFSKAFKKVLACEKGGEAIRRVWERGTRRQTRPTALYWNKSMAKVKVKMPVISCPCPWRLHPRVRTSNLISSETFVTKGAHLASSFTFLGVAEGPGGGERESAGGSTGANWRHVSQWAGEKNDRIQFQCPNSTIFELSDTFRFSLFRFSDSIVYKLTFSNFPESSEAMPKRWLKGTRNAYGRFKYRRIKWKRDFIFEIKVHMPHFVQILCVGEGSQVCVSLYCCCRILTPCSRNGHTKVTKWKSESINKTWRTKLDKCEKRTKRHLKKISGVASRLRTCLQQWRTKGTVD